MSDLLAGLLGALLATNTPLATSNLIHEQTGLSVEIPDPNDPVEKEFQALLELDDEAQAEVDQWIRANRSYAAQGGALPDDQLNLRILRRFDSVQEGYEEFLEEHPEHARAHLAFASFLNDTGNEPLAVEHMEKARELEPGNPAAWNNLANHYGHRGPVKKAFDYYAKAVELNPNESVYYHNFGTTVFLFRKDAREHYGITEQQVFDKALELYAHAIRLQPDDFPLASDIAQTYYGIKPFRAEDALRAWDYAMSVARDQIERDGVHIHLARVNRMMGRFDEARRHLNIVTNEMYVELKRRVAKSLDEEEVKAVQTNASPPSPARETD